MKNTSWTDKQILSFICGSEAEREAALKHLLLDQNWQQFAIGYLSAKGATQSDAEDVFQEAIIIFDRNIRHGKFKGNSTLKTYFVSIVKRKWWQVLSKRHPREDLQTADFSDSAQDVESIFISREKKRLFGQALSKIGERCQLILKLYQLDYSMKEIADEAGISNAKMAKKEAYRCRMRFRRFLESNPAWLELLQ